MVTTQKGKKETTGLTNATACPQNVLQYYYEQLHGEKSFSLNNILKSTYNHYLHFMDFYFLQRWVWAFRKERLLVHVSTNNGLERQNGAFKHQYLQTLRKHSLSAMLTILVNEFLPDKYEG